MGKVLDFIRNKKKTEVVVPLHPEDLSIRIARIKASLERINQLMAELKEKNNVDKTN